MTAHIRDARRGDGDAIREVTLAAYQEYAASMPALWNGYRQNIVATLADVGPAEQLVAEHDGTIVGTVLLYPPRRLTSPQGDPIEMPLPEIRLLVVAPATRGRCIGAAPSLGPIGVSSGSSSWRTGGPSTWTRSAICRWRSRPSSCTCSRTSASAGWGATGWWTWTCG